MITEASALFSYGVYQASENDTQLKLEQEKPFYIQIIIMLCFVITTLGAIMNLITLGFICFSVKKDKFIVYVLNLALVDLTAVLYQFLILIFLYQRLLPRPYISHLIVLLYMCAYEMPLYLLTVICAERCLTIYFPAWTKAHRPKHLSPLICLFLWSLSSLVSLVRYFACYRSLHLQTDTRILNCNVAQIFQVLVTFLIFTPSLILFFFAIVIKMKRKLQETFPARLDISIVILVVLYFIFGLSVKVFEAILHWSDTGLLSIMTILIMLFSTISSSVKPFVYLIVGCSKMEPIHLVLERALNDKDEMRA